MIVKTIALIICSLAFSVSAEWRLLSPMPTPRSEMSAGFANGKIYVPGGLGGMRRLQAYDIAGDRWESLAALPAGRHHLMTAAYNDRIYIFGGGDEKWRPTASAWVYEPKTDRWRALTGMPEPRYAGAAVVLNDYIYIVGGDGTSGRLLRYDPRKDTWSILAPTRQRREHTGAAVFQGKIVVVGGRFRGQGELKSCEIYDVDSDSWHAGPDLQTARGGHAVLVHRDNLMVFGGEVIMTGAKKTLNDSEQLDSLSGAWRRGNDLPLALHGIPMASSDQALFILGGSERAGSAINRGRVYRYLD